MRLIHEIQPTTIGDLFFLNAVHDKSHVRAEYIGCLDKEYLLFKLPKVAKNPRDLYALKAGLPLTIRIVNNPESLEYVTFSASIQSITTVKVPLIVVEFPQNVQVKNLRSERRLSIELMAELEMTDGTKLLALVTDISLSGFKCECIPQGEQSLATLHKELPNKVVSLTLSADNDTEDSIHVAGTVKNSQLKEKLHLGIQFNDDSKIKVRDTYIKLLMDAD